VVWTALALWACLIYSSPAAPLPSGWRYDQEFNVPAPGLVKLSLPPTTLDSARPSLEDVRILDDTAGETTYFIERPMPAVKTIQTVKSFQVSMQPRSTIITVETGVAQPLDTIGLETPASDFIKPVRVEGSRDGKNWQTLAQGQPIFRQLNGASRMAVSFPSGAWAWLKLTVDDQRFAPIPFTGARVHATVIEPAPTEWMPAAISERNENPGETRIAVNLRAANLTIANVRIGTVEPLFTRRVRLAVPQVSEEAIREQNVGQGVIYKVAVEDQPASENLVVPVGQLVRSRELVLLVDNGDSPPLPISEVRVERRPVYLVFLARKAGAFHLLTGNSHCAAPRYDLAAMGANLKSVGVSPIQLPAPAENPSYQTPEVLAGVADAGAALETADWAFRKPVKIIHPGAQQLELDFDIIARAQSDFSDLRLMRGDKQIPYILEHPSISRAIRPGVTVAPDAKDKTLSRWILKLPGSHLPVNRVACDVRTALFERSMTLYEEVGDERGEKFRSQLGDATWTQTPARKHRDFYLVPNGRPQTDTLILETHNGDNPPIELENVQAFCPVTRVLFKAKPGDEYFLYYGNPRVAPPRYDLSLVADELLGADKAAAMPGTQDTLKKPSWGRQIPGTGGLVFWGALALVVVVLLLIISRLLPKAPPPPAA
jgi:hypothetical protein